MTRKQGRHLIAVPDVPRTLRDWGFQGGDPRWFRAVGRTELYLGSPQRRPNHVAPFEPWRLGVYYKVQDGVISQPVVHLDYPDFLSLADSLIAWLEALSEPRR